MQFLDKTDAQLILYDGTRMNTVGKCNIMCTKGDKKFKVEFIVVQKNTQPLLGAATCIKEQFIIIPEINQM